MLCGTSSTELTELTAISRLDPWGERQMDWRFAVLCSAVQNSTATKQADCKSPDDYLAVIHPEPETREPDDEPERDPRDVRLETALLRLTAQLGGTVVNNQ